LTLVAPSGIYLLGRHADCGGSALLVDRFNSTGVLDQSFGTAGELAVDEVDTEPVLTGRGIGLQPNGQILSFVETVSDATTGATTGRIIRLLANRAANPGPTIDAMVSADATTGSNAIATPNLTTTGSGRLLVAAIAADGLPNARQRVSTVSGGGLTWTLAVRASDSHGTSEIWQAYATNVYSDTVTATLSRSGFHASITVVAFAGAGPSIAATASDTRHSNHPQLTLTTTHANSLVVAVGHDASAAAARTPEGGQLILHQFIDIAANQTMWVQSTNGPVTTPGPLTVGTSAPAKVRWQLAAAEVPAA
jgi:hypothetical protein